MKNKIKIFLFMLIIILPSAFAGNIYNLYTSDESGKDLINVDYDFFQCKNNDNRCEKVKDDYHVNINSGLDNHIKYEARGTENPSNYAFYLYKKGYLPSKFLLEGDYGTGKEGNAQLVLEKANDCKAPIINSEIKNKVYANEPLQIDIESQLDVETASAFQIKNFSPHYIPEEWNSTKKELFEASTRLQLQIKNTNTGTIEYIKTKHADIYADNTKLFTFNWIPKKEGEYEIKFKSDVVDNQCENSLEVSEKNIIDVLPERPQDEYYSIIKDLDTYPAHPVEDDNLEYSFKTVSVFAKQNYEKISVPTNIDINIKNCKLTEKCNNIYTDSYQVKATEDSTTFASINDTFHNIPAGWITMNVKATPEMSNINKKFHTDQIYREIYVNEKLEKNGTCADGIDNDNDNYIDENDPDCLINGSYNPRLNETTFNPG
ncbi:MAG: hypothetical protein ACQER9_04885, partial [Nanobdellota archaeon]